MKRILLVGLLGAAGCVDAQVAQWQSLGTPAHVVCYSMGQKIYEGHSTGAVMEDEDGNVRLKDAATGKLVEVLEAQCVVQH